MLERIVARLGGSPTQYRDLLRAEKLIEQRALEGKNDLSNLSLAVTCVFGFIMSVIFTFMPFLVPMDTFSFALIGITVSMMMVGFWTIPYFDLLLTPIYYPVIAHTPVSSRTYFLVKLTQVLTYTVLLLGSLNLMPAIGGIWVHKGEFSYVRLLYPIVYLPIAFMSGFFTVGVMTMFAGYLTKLYSQKTLRQIAQYAQFIFPALVPVVFILFSRFFAHLSTAELLTSLKWFYALPNGWFAGTVSLLLGNWELQFLILGGLAVVSTLLLVFVPLRSIARSYAKYLSYLLESGGRGKARIRVKTPLSARLFRNRTLRAGLCLTAVYMRRHKNILRQFFGSLGSILLLLFMTRDQDWVNYSLAFGLSPGFSGLANLIGISVIFTLLAAIRTSEHYRAAWLFSLAPLSAAIDLWRGVQAAAILYTVLPITLAKLFVATWIWGLFGIAYVLPSTLLFLNFVVLYPKPVSTFPLSEEFVQKQVSGETWIPFIVSFLTAAAFIGLQLLCYWLNIWLYYGFYGVTVVGGAIAFIYFWCRTADGASSDE